MFASRARAQFQRAMMGAMRPRQSLLLPFPKMNLMCLNKLSQSRMSLAIMAPRSACMAPQMMHFNTQVKPGQG